MKNIDLQLIEKMAENMVENSLTEISLELGEQKLILKKEILKKEVIVSSQKNVQRVIQKNENKNFEKAVTGSSDKVIFSPMTGTFYSSPSPGADSFIEQGSEVKQGEIVCIVEAMKMMNEVSSEFSGKILKVLVQDGDIVQKGDKLFIVE